MGTYNYAPGSITNYFQHDLYDVKPWKKWGNTDKLSYEEIDALDSGYYSPRPLDNYLYIEPKIASRRDALLGVEYQPRMELE